MNSIRQPINLLCPPLAEFLLAVMSPSVKKTEKKTVVVIIVVVVVVVVCKSHANKNSLICNYGAFLPPLLLQF